MKSLNLALYLQCYVQICLAYTKLSNSFLRNVSSTFDQGDRISNRLLPRLLQPRMIGSPGHADVQAYIADMFASGLPKWSLRWQNSTIPEEGVPRNVANMVYSREPPWTKPGQANFLTFAAHYDGNLSSVSAAGSAVPCALLFRKLLAVEARNCTHHTTTQISPSQ